MPVRSLFAASTASLCVAAALAFVMGNSGCGSKLPGLAGAGDDTGDAGDDGGSAGDDTITPVLGGSGGSGADGSVLLGNGNVESGDGSANQTGCTDAAKLVYVVDLENTLHSFDPGSLTFSTIGTLRCPSVSTPNSMAVDRTGIAWVNYSDGNLFKVSTVNAACQATAYKAGQANLGLKYGMAFASDTSGSINEHLYIIGIGSTPGQTDVGHGLATIDTTTLTATLIGDFTNGLAGHAGELTGTGDARLFGFFEANPSAMFAQIDKATAATAMPGTLQGVNTGNAFAFSFWGGDFWFYTAVETGTSSVTRLKASSDNSLTQVLTNVGFSIVGAGVSTCAPTIPVR